MSKCSPLTAARQIALLALWAGLAGCDDTTVVVRSGTLPREDDRSGLVVVVSHGDASASQPRATPVLLPPIGTAPRELPAGNLGTTAAVPALGLPAQGLTVLLLIFAGRRLRQRP